MSSLKLNKLGFLIAGASLLALVAAQGCSSDDDSQAMPTAGSAGTGKAGNGNGEGGSGDTNGEGGSGNVGNTSNGGGNSDAGTGPSSEAGNGGEAGGMPAAGCTDATGCYTCTPTNSAQFENKCVTGGCPDTFTDPLSKKALVGTL